jgi:hypothetical protein
VCQKVIELPRREVEKKKRYCLEDILCNKAKSKHEMKNHGLYLANILIRPSLLDANLYAMINT